MSPKPGGADDYIATGRGADDLTALHRESLGVRVTRLGDDMVVTWPEQRVECLFTHLHENSRGVEGEILVRLAEAEIHWGRLVLNSTSGRADIIRALKEKDPKDQDPKDPKAVGWRTIVEQTCYLVTCEVRRGEPTVLLRAQRRTGPRHIVAPLVEPSGATVLYGDGGSGKGLLALIVGIASTTGRSMAGLRPTARGPVLYLDWESSREDHEHRLHLLGAGLDIDTEGLVHYRHLVRPLAEEAAAVRAELAVLGRGLVIVDSLAPACGAEPEGADAVIRTMLAIRSLNVPTLVLAHISGASTAMRGATRPYGSVFVWNLARSCWEVKRSEDTDAHVVQVGLFHRKINEGVYQTPLGLHFTFDPAGDHATRCVVGTLDMGAMGQASDLVTKLPLARRILAVLTPGALTTEEIAEATSAPVKIVRTRLADLVRRGQAVKLDAGGGRGNQTRWGLGAR